MEPILRVGKSATSCPSSSKKCCSNASSAAFRATWTVAAAE